MENFPKIVLPFPYHPKKRKKNNWKVGYVGLNLSNGPGFGNSSGDGGNGGTMGGSEGGGAAMGESTNGFIYKFSCAMLELSDDIAPILAYWAKKNIPTESLYINSDQGIEGYIENNHHITVKYGLHDDNPDKIKQLVEGFGPITVNFGNVEKFNENPLFDVLKINIVSDKLKQLNKIICDNMEYSDEWNEYNPHATLAYVKKNSCDNFIGDTFFDKLTDTINQLSFHSKTGEVYQIEL